ncbi:hypothetical protein FACS1894133_2930 [Clostridia bacterium]|nr:hypothetical protein FACS1894133_2930 [Clostridia bacterium]
MDYEFDYKFEWDELKNTVNISKHHVTFEVAQTVFRDENALLLVDENHSDTEERFLIIGHAITDKTLTVCHCYKQSDTVIRIISARDATKQETRRYWEAL